MATREGGIAYRGNEILKKKIASELVGLNSKQFG